MTKSELVDRLVAQDVQLRRRDMERVIDTIFEEISDALVAGCRIELRGFGAFFVRLRHARMGRNPRTGKEIAIRARWGPMFRTSKRLHARLNSDLSSSR